MNYEQKLKSHIWFKELVRQAELQGETTCLNRNYRAKNKTIIGMSLLWSRTSQGDEFWRTISRDMEGNILPQ